MEKRRKGAERAARFRARRAAETATPEAVPESNPFATFVPEPATLTAEQRAAEQAKLDDFFERKLADPNATWNAAPVSDVDENPFKDWVTGQPIPER